MKVKKVLMMQEHEKCRCGTVCRTSSGDFSMEEFQVQTDGEIFWKTTEGRDDMPTFKKKVPSDEDRWLMVNYIRTLAEE